MEKLPSAEAHTEQELNLLKQNKPHGTKSYLYIAFEILWPYVTFELLKGGSSTGFDSINPEQSLCFMLAQICYYERHAEPGFCKARCGRGKW